MLLKRIYDPKDLERFQAEKAAATSQEEIDQITPPTLDYIALAHTGIEPEQNFSVKLVTEGLESGLIEIVDDELFFHVHPEDLRYTIKRSPGRYCLHCGEKLQDDPAGAMARLHIAQKHAGETSPDPANPSGYEAINAFECVLDEQQHETYRVKDKARAPQFFLKEA